MFESNRISQWMRCSVSKGLTGVRSGQVGALCGSLMVMLVLAALPMDALAVEVSTGDSCIDCHRNPDFMVSQRKLYDYYQRWQVSTHAHEDVACADCHGGNPAAKTKDKAHGAAMTTQGAKSLVRSEKIPETCGTCHNEILDAYRTSEHAKHLVNAKDKKQGPNCVTCHGSVSVDVPIAATVVATCEKCHNKKTDNHADIPATAATMLNEYGAIRGFSRYVRLHGDIDLDKEIRAQLGPGVQDLGVLWHTFDLKKIVPQTETILKLARDKKELVRERRKESK